MASYLVRGLAGISVALAASASFAQDVSTNRVAAITDWSVFVDSNPTRCWSVSAPKESVNTKDGRVVAVRRGDILLLVAYIPSKDAKGQVMFTGGYKFSPNTQVTLQIADQTFSMFTVLEDDPATSSNEDEFAWSPTDADDTKLLIAMKRGAAVVVTGLSSRGTTTKDTFSLLGFTAANAEAESRCEG
jgi:hypothetical protein